MIEKATELLELLHQQEWLISKKVTQEQLITVGAAIVTVGGQEYLTRTVDVMIATYEYDYLFICFRLPFPLFNFVVFIFCIAIFSKTEDQK